MSVFIRSFPLLDIEVRSDGDGRTVDAYAAVFDEPVEIHDGAGHYMERIAGTAFDRTLAQRGTKFGVFFNHGTTIYGTPSERYSMPIGTPVEVRADGRGLFTRTRYNATPVADEVLEAIRTGAITGQSFSGRFLRSDKATPKFGFKPATDGTLVEVTRTEIAMREYGPTPFPAYEAAAIVGLRSIDPESVARALRDLDDDERAEIAALLSLPAARSTDPAQDDSTAAGPAVNTDEPAELRHAGRSPLHDHLSFKRRWSNMRKEFNNA
jgi:HK97 family phage prohead protease